MLAAAVATAVLANAGPDGTLSFSLADLRENVLASGSQDWIFCFFAAAFLVKMPAFPIHGWMPDAYRAAPLPVLVVFSAVVSKIGVYGFLKIVLPILPDAAQHFQELMLALAVVSILYGSALAFSQDSARLVVAYSSIAQLGFITLGVFALDDRGAQGALMQMVNHGLVVAPLFFVIGALALRTGGSDSLSDMGGAAFRAPVLAALFLIVTLATLAMPGSPNFVGEILILFGALETKLVYGLVASVGVALAAVYMIRFFQRAMHNRVGPRIESREIGALELAVIAPVTAVVVALGVYPQLLLERTEPATKDSIVGAVRVARGEPARAQPAPAQGPEQQLPPGAEQLPPEEVPPEEVPPGAEQLPPEEAPAP
jgi:NADH-quinone oxidoreductase subunit M